METMLQRIIAALRTGEDLGPAELERLIRICNRERPKGETPHAKKELLPFYTQIKNNQPELWKSWGITPELERKLIAALTMKPSRTASGVATITVLTKPYPCSSDCLYCPNDIRMPKSYLSDEPACQRAERNCFDPYLQVSVRLSTLIQMGHVTDRVELIILGGTWTDYPRSYQTWFMSELSRALNDGCQDVERIEARRAFYENAGFDSRKEKRKERFELLQDRVRTRELTYNEAFAYCYEDSPTWMTISARQVADEKTLQDAMEANETSAHRLVGLCIETRPDRIDAPALVQMRAMGCTKVQVGIQSLDERILSLNNRALTRDWITASFELLRAFGFKVHAHFMVNLLGATPETDREDFSHLVEDPAFQPDEIKLYPCALVDGTGLVEHYRNGSWQPYGEETLVGVLVDDMLATPGYMRISRMIRDISAHDIMAGNKKINLRQRVEEEIGAANSHVHEIRYNELRTALPELETLEEQTLVYRTTNTEERFIEWVTQEGKLAGYVRLSLLDASYSSVHAEELPPACGGAMIRELHICGHPAARGDDKTAARRDAFLRTMVDAASAQASDLGFAHITVFNAGGERALWRGLGFEDAGSYQQRQV